MRITPGCVRALLGGLLLLARSAPVAGEGAAGVVGSGSVGSESVPVSTTQPFVEVQAAETVAFRVLQRERQIVPVSPEMSRTLHDVLDQAVTAIRQLEPIQGDRWDRHHALKVLKTIDSVLIRFGFLYPVTGSVDLMADALKPFQLSAEKRSAFEAQPHNQRRLERIRQGFPGPFHVLDCDTACFIYLSVAELTGLPLKLVTIPSLNRRIGHTFVRWREGSNHLNWETMDGVVRSDDFYEKEWKIPAGVLRGKSAMKDLSRAEVDGFIHYLIAVSHSRRRQHEQAILELDRAVELYPDNLDARREFAWVTATAPVLRNRRNNDAISNALFVLERADDPDIRDTLAASHASAGRFDLAIREERAAIASGWASREARVGYRQRLALYEQGRAFRQPVREQEDDGLKVEERR